MKKLYRSEENKTVSGVIGGIGEYLNIDPILLRVLWVIVVIFTGFIPGIIAYIAAIFIIPKRPNHERKHVENETAD